MSRLDHEVAEDNRLAEIRHRHQQEEQARIDAWLTKYPEIGVLNGGRYYITVDGETVYLKKYEIPLATMCLACKDDYGSIAQESFIAGVCPDCRDCYSNEELLEVVMENQTNES